MPSDRRWTPFNMGLLMVLSFPIAYCCGHENPASRGRGFVQAPINWLGSVALGDGALALLLFLLHRALALFGHRIRHLFLHRLGRLHHVHDHHFFRHVSSSVALGRDHELLGRQAVGIVGPYNGPHVTSIAALVEYLAVDVFRHYALAGPTAHVA